MKTVKLVLSVTEADAMLAFFIDGHTQPDGSILHRFDDKVDPGHMVADMFVSVAGLVREWRDRDAS